jgi:threonine dehydrogenase-like Zn-dependent dehydrogenase
VVLIGAGGVGLSGLHVAPSVLPAKLIVADTDPAKRGIARQAGAFATIDNGEPDAVAQVIELSGGGARGSIDFVGAPRASPCRPRRRARTRPSTAESKRTPAG